MLFPVYLKAAIFLQTRFGEEQRPFYTRGPRLKRAHVIHLQCTDVFGFPVRITISIQRIHVTFIQRTRDAYTYKTSRVC